MHFLVLYPTSCVFSSTHSPCSKMPKAAMYQRACHLESYVLLHLHSPFLVHKKYDPFVIPSVCVCVCVFKTKYCWCNA